MKTYTFADSGAKATEHMRGLVAMLEMYAKRIDTEIETSATKKRAEFHRGRRAGYLEIIHIIEDSNSL